MLAWKACTINSASQRVPEPFLKTWQQRKCRLKNQRETQWSSPGEEKYFALPSKMCLREKYKKWSVIPTSDVHTEFSVQPFNPLPRVPHTTCLTLSHPPHLIPSHPTPPLPHLTLSHPTLPHPTSPYITPPYPASPHPYSLITLPHLAPWEWWYTAQRWMGAHTSCKDSM